MAAAAGLVKDVVPMAVRRGNTKGCTINDLRGQANNLLDSLKDTQGRRLRSTAWLFDEPTVYKMLLRGHAPQSEPFRKWLAC